MGYIATFIGICWIAFWLYWITSALQSKGSLRPSNTKVFFGLRLGVLAVAAILAIGFNQLPQSFRDQALGTGTIIELLGLALFIFGIVLAVWARIKLGKNWGLPITEKQHPTLVTSGPYHVIRHPIYTGMLAMTLGSVLDVNPYWLLVFTVAAIYFVCSAIIEEQHLTKQFGKPYVQYKRRTKMLIPFLF